MRIAVIGGGLQGIEAVYLAKKAGWEVSLFDKKPSPPAIGLADHFIQHDVAKSEGLGNLMTGVDLILPALEDTTALDRLALAARDAGIPFVYDVDAYAVSSSKLASNRLFERLQLPTPLPWPECELPLVAKPAFGSGSQGVRLLVDSNRLQACLPGYRSDDQWVLQEYLPGSLHSLEVIGYQNHYQALQVTDLEMDATFDCKRVLAPSELPPELVAEFESMALTIAQEIELNGIMDIEVVRCGGRLKILEIDARLPSQTPLTVLGSSGLNMAEALARLFCGGSQLDATPNQPLHGALLEHVRLGDGLLEIGGEHLMTTGGPLHLEADFFNADEAITNYRADCSDWVATLIFRAADRTAVWRKRNHVIEQIMAHFCVQQYLDLEPMRID